MCNQVGRHVPCSSLSLSPFLDRRFAGNKGIFLLPLCRSFPLLSDRVIKRVSRRASVLEIRDADRRHSFSRTTRIRTLLRRLSAFLHSTCLPLPLLLPLPVKDQPSESRLVPVLPPLVSSSRLASRSRVVTRIRQRKRQQQSW